MAQAIDMTDKQTLNNLSRLETIFRCNGFDPEQGRKVSMKDALDIPQAAFLIPKVLTPIVQEGVEPMLIGTSLLQKIDYVPGMHSVFPAFDILTAREVGDGAALPIFNINVGGGTTYGVQVKRHGLALRITDTFVQNSTYPWLQMWLRLAGNALARHTEEYIFSYIRSLGTIIFDNSKAVRTSGYTGQRPMYGATTGRDMTGRYNGGFTADDLFTMYSQVLMQGFIPDTILIHPLLWMVFMRDPIMREFAIQAGGGSFFAQFNGNPAAQAYQGFYNNKGLGQGLGQTAGNITGPESLPQNQNSSFQIPGYANFGNLRILVSPFVRFNTETKETDIMMFNSKNLGALIVKNEPHVKAWDEPQYGIQNIGIESEFGFGVLNEGQAIAVARNVKVRANEFNPQARSVISIGPDNPNFEQPAGLFGDNPIDVNADRSGFPSAPGAFVVQQQ
jgi:hypothetical protein